ncbi:hypothetical protein [Undibacterium sp. KW1]|uniref:hypothetical protein n=1 Tax=Undibacterium sp. KW1 TaxID=2058624 RepID=UPI00138A67C3|nr:hypothetical protein [Undibacterium sp. KW1]
MKIHKICILALVIFLSSNMALAQCENEEAVRITAAKMKADISANKAQQKTRLDETLQSFNVKTDALGWTKVQKSEFLKKMQENGQYVYLSLKLQEQQLSVMMVQNELGAKDVKDDPVQACTVALKYIPLFLKITELNEELFDFMKKKIEAIK